MAGWSEAELNRLGKLVKEGLSASLIGEAMGRSRNAVIGKILRMNGKVGRLTARNNSQKASARSRKPAAPRPARATPPASARSPKPESKPALAAMIRCEPVHNLPATLPITFLDAIDRGRCLYFAGDPLGAGGPEMPVCGAERTASHPRYCRRHSLSAIHAGGVR